MLRKLLSILLILTCLVSCVGCGSAVSEITDSVLSAAKAELVKQIQAKLEEYKVDILETKTAIGDLNGGGKYQFFCAILIQTNSEDLAADCAKGVGKLFGTSGYLPQTGASVESEYLVNKTITYSQTDLSAGNYYTVYIYVADMTKVIDFSSLTGSDS